MFPAADELILTGNSIEGVSQSAVLIQQSATVKNKDIRKFLGDGVLVVVVLAATGAGDDARVQEASRHPNTGPRSNRRLT